jgi:tetratricopeptide (TPR) repeat protein
MSKAAPWDHRGAVAFSQLYPLSHLNLGRAYVQQGDTAKARAAYQDFFALWKDADPDVPLLKEAKAEYAKLQQASIPVNSRWCGASKNPDGSPKAEPKNDVILNGF